MIDLTFKFRPSTEEEIILFSEEFSNVYRLNPEVKFITAELQNENYAIFATKEESDSSSSEIRILFFLILDHPLKNVITIYNLFYAFVRKMTYVEPTKENLGKSKRIYWNLQDEKYHMYFEEVIYKDCDWFSNNESRFHKDGLFVQYNYEYNAGKKK